MEEERRLAFVALTRAKRGLYLSASQGRSFDGSPRYPSRFLLDIDQELLTFVLPPREGLIHEAREYIDRSWTYLAEDDGTALPVGQRVRHAVFGPGTVLDVDMDLRSHVVQFDGMETPRRISFRRSWSGSPRQNSGAPIYETSPRQKPGARCQLGYSASAKAFASAMAFS